MKRGSNLVKITIVLSSVFLILLIIKEIQNSGNIGNLNGNVRNLGIDNGNNVIDTEGDSKEFSDLKSTISRSQGVFGLYIKDVGSNKVYEINSNETYYPLSLYKLPIAYIVARDVQNGDLSWDDELSYTRADYFNQFGTIASYGFGSEFSLEKVVELMLRESDNVAPKMIARYLGEDYINSEYRKMTGNKKADLFDEDSFISPKSFSLLIENIFLKEWLDDQTKDKILSFLYPTSYDLTITPYLDESLTYYHKVGISENMYHDCGLVKSDSDSLIVCLMSKDTSEESLDEVSKKTADFINSLLK